MFKQSDIEDIYSLSPMQEGMFFHYHMDKESTVYFEQMDINIRGEIDIDLLGESFKALVQRHSILRTVFTSKKLKKNRQVVLKKRNTKIFYEDISTLEEPKKNSKIEAFKEEDKKRGFNLSKDIPMRVSVLKTAAGSYRIILSFHHIILDGWSVGIIYKDLLQIYQLLRKNEPLRLKPVNQYKHYIKWLEKQDINEGLKYWQDYLQGYEQPVVLPRSYGTLPQGKYKRAQYKFSINEVTTGKLVNFARENQTTLSTIFQVLWGILLKKYNKTQDVVFGVIVSGRPPEIKGIDDMVGLFLNNVPLRLQVEDGYPFDQLVRDTQEKVLKSKSYEHLSLDQIQAHSILKGSLIDHIVVFENYPVQDTLKRFDIQGLGFTISGMEIYEQTNYDFVVMAYPGESLSVEFQYNSLAYQDQLAEQMASHLEELITRAMENPQISIRELTGIPGKRKTEIIEGFNEDLKKEAASLLGEEETLQRQLQESFQKNRHKTALEYGAATMTYARLEQKSALVARWIINKGIKKQTLFGILLEDRMELIAVVIGIIRAGCVIAPFYTAYPVERIQAMISSTDIKYIVIDEINLNRFEQRKLSLQNRTLLFPRELYSHKHSPAAAGIEEAGHSPADQLYIHFTSGTTGIPKAIVGKNDSLLHFIKWEIETFKIDNDCRTAQFTIPGFDPFLRDTFVPLLCGGVVCIPENENILLNAPDLIKWLNHHGITLIHCVASLFRLMNSASLNADDLQALQTIMLAGEKINPSDLVNWYNIFGPRIQLANCYGPTETTMSKACHLIRESDLKRERIPIGKPIKGARIIILDEKMEICDTLEAGEICIRTPYRSLGYYNDEELTRRKFMVNPFGNHPGDIIYRSGDLGRFLADGSIDILGRIDRQVKIRGHRIELEEIEHALTKYPRVKEAVLIKEEISSNNEILCAFIIPASDQEVEKEKLPGDIKEYLKAKLPDYMVPAKIITINKMPRKATGKVDNIKLKQLLREELTDHDSPRDLVEEKLLNFWQEILGIKNIGLNRRFFDVGGSSLNVMTLISRIHKEFDIRISLVDLFNNPTIEKQAKILREFLKKETYSSIKRAENKEFYTLSSGQDRLYMMQQMDPTTTAYNLPTYIRLQGHLDKQQLETTFMQLTQRHESLRTSFVVIEGEPVQKIHNHVELEVEYYELGGSSPGGNSRLAEEEKAIVTRFIQPFDLARAPLARVGLVKIQEKEFLLMVDIHHIVTDGVSLAILVDEFMALYGGKELPPLRLRYRDYSEWQNSEEHRQLRKRQESFWLKEFEGIEQLQPLNLRPDYERPPGLSFAGSDISFQLEKEKMEALQALAREEEVTLFTVLLAIFNIMLAQISGQDDIVVGTPVACRNHAELENIFGMFVNTLPLRNQCHNEETFVEFLEVLNKKTLKAFENQDYPFEDLVRILAVHRDENRNPLFDVLFVLQNVGIKELKLPGLKLIPYRTENSVTKFDMTLNCLEQGDSYRFILAYRTTLFKKEKIERYVEYFKQFVAAVAENKHIKIKDIEIAYELSYIETQNINIEFEF